MRVALGVSLLAVTVVVSACTGSPADAPSDGDATQDDGAVELIDAAVSDGPYATDSVDYRLPELRLPGLSVPVEVQGHVVGPVDAAAPLPLVLLLHGYSASCRVPGSGDSSTEWPCPKGQRPIPNALGFDYLQQRLASQGYLTVSVSANGVNVLATQMSDDAGSAARSELVRHHLDLLADGEVGDLSTWPEVDTDRVLLVGHSRGGEGVDRAVAERPADASWDVRGTVLIGTTAFEPAPRSSVSTVVVTGDCDGDVGPGPGQRYVDRPADPPLLRTAVIVDGANHNYFNAEWSPDTSSLPIDWDDAYLEDGSVDPLCDPEGDHRLEVEEQQDVALRVLGLAAAALLRDQGAPADVLDGQRPFPSAGQEVVHISALGRGRTTLTYGSGYTATTEGPVTASPCVAVSETEAADACGRLTGEGQSVHWPAEERRLRLPPSLEVSWAEPGGVVMLDLDQQWDLSSATGVEARVAVAPDSPPVEFDVVLTDLAGETLTLPSAQPLEALAGGELLPSRRWGQRLFAPLDGPDGADGVDSVDLTAIAAVGLVPRSPRGQVWLIDLSAPPVDPPALP